MPDFPIIPATGEPVSVAEAKAHMRVTDTAQDAIIAMMISAARRKAETITRQQFMIERRKAVLDRFPMAGIGTPLPFAHVVNIPGYAIMLEKAPVLQIVSIDYLDMSGTSQTMPASDYIANTAMKPALVQPRFGKIWPITLPQTGAVTVTYDAGYASPISAVSGNGVTVSGPYVWAVGDVVEFITSAGILPTGLAEKTPYKIATVTVVSSVSTTYTVSDMSGNAVTLTGAGSGANYLSVSAPERLPEGIRSWILIRTATLYENREEVAILNRGSIQELPFMDGLLDPYRVSLP